MFTEQFEDSVREAIADELRNFKDSVINQLRDDEESMVSEYGGVFVSSDNMFEEFESIEEIYAGTIVKCFSETMQEHSLEVVGA